MFGGKVRVPLTVRTLMGAGMQAAAQHSQSLYWITAGIPGLKTVIPSNPADAKGLLLAAIRDDDPVDLLRGEDRAHERRRGARGRLRGARSARPRSCARAATSPSSAWGARCASRSRPPRSSPGEGVNAEVLDLRSLQPLDEEAILATLEKTGRLVVVDESTPRCGIASDVAALCVDRGFDFLEAPVKKVTAPFTPVPFSRVLEQAFMPSAAKVVDAVRSLG